MPRPPMAFCHHARAFRWQFDQQGCSHDLSLIRLFLFFFTTRSEAFLFTLAFCPTAKFAIGTASAIRLADHLESSQKAGGSNSLLNIRSPVSSVDAWLCAWQLRSCEGCWVEPRPLHQLGILVYHFFVREFSNAVKKQI